MVSESSATTGTAVRPINRWRRTIALALISLLIATIFIAWLAGTRSGAQASFQLLGLVSAGQIQANDIRGSFLHQLQIGQMTITTSDEKLTISDLRLEWQALALTHRLLRIDRLHIGALVIQTSAQTTRPPRNLPASLQLPFKVLLDRCDIDKLSIRKDNQAQATIEGLQLSWRFDKVAHILSLQSAHLTQLSSVHTDSHLKAQFNLQASTPFALQSDMHLTGKQNGWYVEATGHIKGDLNTMTAKMVMRLGQPQMQTKLSVQAQLQPFTEQLISAGELSAERLDLSKIKSDWPTTQMAVHIALSSKTNGNFSIRNALAGTWDKSLLPVTDASGRWRLQDDDLIFDDVHINHDNLTGSIKRQRGQWQIFLQAKQLNLKGIDSRLRTTHLNGSVHLIQEADNTNLRIALSESWRSKSLQIHAEASLKKSLLTVRSAKLSLGDAVADISGDVQLSGIQKFDVRGDVKHLKLAELGKFSYLPDIALTGRFDLKGQRYPGLQLALDFSVTDSRIGRHAVNGEGKLQLNKNLLRISDLELRAGDNLLQANGELSEHHGELNFLLKASQLSQLGSSFAGQLTMRGKISGDLQQPKVIADWQGHDLRLPYGLSMRNTQGRLQAGGTLSSPLAVHADFQDATVSDTLLRSAHIDLDGTAQQQTISVRLDDAKTRLHLSATGGVDVMNANATWRGQLQQARLAGKINATLEQSAAIAWSKNLLQLDRLHVSSNIGRFLIDHFRRDKEAIVSRGHITQFHIGHLATAVKFAPIMQSDLQLNGDWDLSLPQQGQKKPQGLMKLYRTSGDLRLSDASSTALQLQQLDANLQLRDGRLSFQFKAQGERLGHLSFSGGTRLRDTEFLPQAAAPVDGVLKISLPTLSYLGPLLSPNLITAGQISAQVSLTGNLSSPVLVGTISAAQLHLQWLDQGLSLTHGMLQADFHDDQLQVRQLSFAGSRGSTGRIVVNGPIRLNKGSIESDLHWRATRFSLFNRSDRQLILSGDGQINTFDQRAQLSGELIVDEGFIDLGREETPQLSDDVIIIGKPPPNTPMLRMEVDLGIGLGEKLSIRGRGINARLGGALRIKSRPGDGLSANGLMLVTRGTYTAYGRELAIERGVLRFDGSPGNPALDIRAMRRGTQVEPGVMITGTVLAPRIRLISEPQVPDAEKISWLVLGQGLSGTTDQQAGVLQDAAASLLTQNAAASVQSQIAGSLGLDSITLSRRPDNVQQRIITLGKRISSRVYLSYQQGLQAAGAVVLLRYTLSRRITVEAETGTRSVFSLFYNFSFD
jgi:translocation and assembly module TamB